MEFHEIPGRPCGPGGGAACADHQTGQPEARDRGAAVNENEKNQPATEVLPDRLSVDPASDVGVRFKGVDKTNVEEYCVSEGWVRITAGNAKDRHGNPLTIKVHG